MEIKAYALGQMQANCYMVTQGDHCLIIDPADSADFILEELQRKKLVADAVLATHGHFDHIMGAGELQLSLEAQYGRPFPLYIHEADLFLVHRLQNTAKHFLGPHQHVLPIQKTLHVQKGPLQLGTFNLEVLFTPGHTPGSCSYYFDKAGVMFTGDTLFKSAIGRYDFSYSDKLLLKNSLNILLRLPEETLVYPGHGEQTSIGDEKK